MECRGCGKRAEFAGVTRVLILIAKLIRGWEQEGCDVSGMICSNCDKVMSLASLAAQLHVTLHATITRYYQSPTLCDDVACGYVSRALAISRPHDCLQCNGPVTLQFDHGQLWTRLMYLNHLVTARTHQTTPFSVLFAETFCWLDPVCSWSLTPLLLSYRLTSAWMVVVLWICRRCLNGSNNKNDCEFRIALLGGAESHLWLT